MQKPRLSKLLLHFSLQFSFQSWFANILKTTILADEISVCTAIVIVLPGWDASQPWDSNGWIGSGNRAAHQLPFNYHVLCFFVLFNSSVNRACSHFHIFWWQSTLGYAFLVFYLPFCPFPVGSVLIAFFASKFIKIKIWKLSFVCLGRTKK